MTTQTSKAKRVEATPRKPSVARAEIVDKATRLRFESELEAAVKRKPAHEAKLAGAFRAVATRSPALRTLAAEAASLFVRRGSFSRELYAASVRMLAESSDRSAGGLLRAALTAAEAGGVATVSAATFSTDPSLGPVLAKVAASRQSHLAFGAEVARVCRHESSGAHLSHLAPMIKESHRISLCAEILVPLARSAPVPMAIAPALSVLRGAERHLGRWLVMAEVAVKAGDRSALDEALAKAASGPSSSRTAWGFVAWALEGTLRSLGQAPLAPEMSPPVTLRPTVELVSRLSDRPSADRDTTFLFRLARARVASAKPMLEGLVKSEVLGDELAIRAACFLARDHARAELRGALEAAATSSEREELRGLAVAALWDIGDDAARTRARDMAEDLVGSKSVSNVAWGALVRVAHGLPHDLRALVVDETAFRWIQWGWLE